MFLRIKFLFFLNLPIQNISISFYSNFLSFEGRKYVEKEIEEIKNIDILVAKEESLSSKIMLTLPNNGTFKLLRMKLNKEFFLNDADFDIYVTKSNFKIPQDREEEYQISVLGNYQYF